MPSSTLWCATRVSRMMCRTSSELLPKASRAVPDCVCSLGVPSPTAFARCARLPQVPPPPSARPSMARSARAALLALALAGTAVAHRPILTKPACKADFSTAESALSMPRADISWAFSTYFTCESSALWMKVKAWKANAGFYIGTGVPAIERFGDVRTRAVILGPGLPQLTPEEVALLPSSITDSPTYKGTGYLHSAPQDQSTCAHLGAVMQEASTVRNGRCDFFEQFGQTNTYWILDADNNTLVEEGADYHVAVWPTERVAAKVQIALGTWQENFFVPIDMVTPGCDLVLDDFHEKGGSQAACAPYRVCADSPGPVGCTPAPETAAPAPAGSAVLDMNCYDFGGAPYTPMMGCGGEACPKVTRAWDAVNMDMHMKMAVNWTGDIERDFVYAMMPHHQGAIDMCDLLVKNLTCAGYGTPDKLEGLVHLCQDVLFWQTREIEAMGQWLLQKGYPQRSMCAGMMAHEGHTDHMHSMEMMEGCGRKDAAGAKLLIEANMKMHAQMGVSITCQHPVDFTRMMAPHHQGGILMTQALLDTVAAEGRTLDPLLQELVTNITRAQHSEVAWMYEWLAGRDLSPIATCANCDDGTQDGSPAVPPPQPCEDQLAQTTYCHGVSQTAWNDDRCLCANLLQKFPCGTVLDMGTRGTLDVTNLCKRTCGTCPARGALFWGCDAYVGAAHAHGDGSMGGHTHGTMDGAAGHDDDDDDDTWKWILVALAAVGVAAIIVGVVVVGRSRAQAASFNVNAEFGKELTPEKGAGAGAA